VPARDPLRRSVLSYDLHLAHSNSPIRPPYIEADELPGANVRLPDLIALQTDLVRIEEYMASLPCFNKPVPCFRVEFRDTATVVLPFDLDWVLVDDLDPNSFRLRFVHLDDASHVERKVHDVSLPRLHS